MTQYSPAELSRLFAELGEHLFTPADSDAALHTLTAMAVERVPGAEYAGVTLGRDGASFRTVCATDELVRRTDELQYTLGSGPCVDAVIADTTFNAADLATDARWPEFGRRVAAELGIVSMLSIRLFTESDQNTIAGLNMYSRRPGAFDETSELIGLLLATHGSLAIGRAAARDQARSLLVALKNSREIGIAMGIVMANAKVTRDQAFDLLRIASQRSHRKVADLATEIADTGTVPELQPTLRSTTTRPD